MRYFIFVVFMFLGVFDTSADQNQMNKANWQRPPDDHAGFYKSRISSNSFHEVSESMQADAQALLENLLFKEINKKDAKRFADTKLMLHEDVNTRFYIVRAVRCGDGGQFAVYHNGMAVYVLHGDLGKMKKMRNTALVVKIDGVISDAYADCSVAQ